MPAGYAEARNLVFHKIDVMAASLGHENIKPEEIAKMVSRAPALARPDAGVEHVDLQFGQQLEPHLQSGSAARERLVLNMNAISLPTLAVEAPAYVELQREMHNALLAQHPEWNRRDGDCPKCDDYDRRFAELLISFLASERAHAH